MPSRSPIPESRLAELAEYAHRKWKGLEHQRFLCVWLRAEKGMTSAAIAGVLGCHPVTVRQVQREFIARGPAVFLDENNGGRRRQLMTPDEEAEFLAGFRDAAASASLLTVGEIKAALEARVGRKVHKTTVYRMLERHGWRKVAPRPKHPKQDKEAQDAFKKGASQIGPPRQRARRRPRGSPSASCSRTRRG
jgi:transposase